jgi:hypothetical protein
MYGRLDIECPACDEEIAIVVQWEIENGELKFLKGFGRDKEALTRVLNTMDPGEPQWMTDLNKKDLESTQ